MSFIIEILELGILAQGERNMLNALCFTESARIISHPKATPEQVVALLPPFPGNFPGKNAPLVTIPQGHDLHSFFLFPAMSLW